MAEVKSSSNDNTNSNDANKLDDIGTWTLVNVSGPSPLKRTGHTLLPYRDSLYLYAGNNQERQLKNLHVFTPTNNCWMLKEDGPVRAIHSAVVINDEMIVFGGSETQEVKTGLFSSPKMQIVSFNDVWCYNFGSQAWSKVVTTGSFPAPRDGHSAVAHKGKMYVFGGSNEHTAFHDLQTYIVGNKLWMRAPAEGTIPSPRRLHSCVVYDDRLWVFGGYDGQNSFNDIFMYNIGSGVWSLVNAFGDVPHKRFGHVAVVHQDAMYIFGGYGGGGGYRNDFSRFDFTTSTWTTISCAMTPPARRGAAAACVGDSIFLFGGSESGTTYSNELWRFDFKTSQSEEIEDPLMGDLQKMLDNPSFYPDVTFKIGEKRIRAHKCLLSVRCPYFDSLFKSAFVEASTSEICVDDIGEEAFMIFLKYLYGAPKSIITPESSFELLTISEKYMLPHLKWICETVVLEGISVEHAATLLIASETYKCERLHKACLDFICKNHQQVLKTEDFKSLPQNLLLAVLAEVSAQSKR